MAATPFFPNRVCYLLLLAIVLFNGVMLATTNATIQRVQIAAQVLMLLPLILVAVAAGVSRLFATHPLVESICARLTIFCQGMVFLMIAWPTVRLFNHLTMKMTADLSYADSFLAHLDRFLALDWVAYFEVLRAYPHVLTVLKASYTSLPHLSVAAFLVICCTGDRRRPRFFLEAFFVAAVICISIGMFLPAKGTVMYHLEPGFEFRHFASAPGLWFVEPLATLRSGDPVLFDIHQLPGLVTFPSFHTAAAVILVASFWRTRLFVPALLYGVTVIAAAPIFGGHYLVDLLGGIAVAAVVILAVQRKPDFANLFRRRHRQAAEPALAGADPPTR